MTSSLFCLLLAAWSSLAGGAPRHAGAQIGPHSLIINEFICKGVNPQAAAALGGSGAKWVELYNPTSEDIELTAGKWFLTDTLGMPQKFPIPANTDGPQWKVPAGKYLVFMCLKKNMTPVPGRINAAFSLSSTKGDIGIYYQDGPGAPLIAVDNLSYDFSPGGAAPAMSYGHKPDGAGPATTMLTKPTPEAPNM